GNNQRGAVGAGALSYPGGPGLPPGPPGVGQGRAASSPRRYVAQFLKSVRVPQRGAESLGGHKESPSLARGNGKQARLRPRSVSKVLNSDVKEQFTHSLWHFGREAWDQSIAGAFEKKVGDTARETGFSNRCEYLVN